MFQCVAHPHEKCMHHDIQQYHMIPMKLQKKVPAMYSNRSTSNHTHGLVPCTQEFILHNPIDEHLNLQQIVSEPATNNVRPCNKVIPSHQTPSHVHCLFPKALQQTHDLLHK
jgi:hypothetical protein